LSQDNAICLNSFKSFNLSGFFVLGVLVVFGSDSDKAVFEPLMEKFKKKGVKARLEVCSAHREPEKLAGILKKAKEKVVVAGAGLSAALPGFIASHSDKLVLGIPVKANYSGLDALLSIHQMPKGFAVLGLGTEEIDEAVEGVERILKGRKKLVLVKPDSEEGLKRFGACVSKLEELGVSFEESEEDSYKDGKAIYIDFIDLDQVGTVDSEGQLVLFVPVKKDSKETDAIKLLLLTRNGLWVGLGRGENAALCAAKILKKE